MAEVFLCMGRFLGLTGLAAGGFLGLTGPLGPRGEAAAPPQVLAPFGVQFCIECHFDLQRPTPPRHFAALFS